MSDPDKRDRRIITDAVAGQLRRIHPPKLAPFLVEDDEGALFDRSCREVLERFERAHQALKAEEE